MDALILLRARLQEIVAVPVGDPERWGDHRALSVVLAKIKNRFDSAADIVDRPSIERAVMEFRKTKQFVAFRDLKYVCYGAGGIYNGGWCLLGDRTVKKVLFEEVEKKTGNQRLKCFQGLLRSYLTFPRFSNNTPEELITCAWHPLREWLNDQLPTIENDLVRRPGWIRILKDNKTLFEKDDPCRPYGEALLRGEGEKLEKVRRGLSIPNDSWIIEETVLAHIRAAIRLPDEGFRTGMDEALKVAVGEEVLINENMKIKAVALLVSRYAACTSRPEHPGLRDAAVRYIGNPWLKKQSWETWVLDKKGKADEKARHMVFSWLKVRLIRDFFETLSDDGKTDPRRLEYWLRFEPIIDDMWFILGLTASNNRGREFVELRKRAVGRLLLLENSTSDNNAFVMSLGGWTVVEFGSVGNACYIYDSTKCPFNLTHRERVNIHDLKVRRTTDAHLRLIHRERWEPAFDTVICRRVRFWPEADSFKRLCEKHGLSVADNRRANGYLWVLTDNSVRAVNQKLENMGFVYRPGKGWWTEGIP